MDLLYAAYDSTQNLEKELLISQEMANYYRDEIKKLAKKLKKFETK